MSKRSCPKRTSARQSDLRQNNAILRAQLAKLAALADHFYCAYRDTRALLDRREHELSELRRRLDTKPIALNR